MTMNTPSNRVSRIEAEAHALATRYGAVTWDDAEGRWLLVHTYPLPRGFSKAASAALVVIPDDYPDVPPYGWYMDLDLLRSDRRRIRHLIVDDERFNLHKKDGYAWFCHEFKDWCPVGAIWGGDNLLSFFEWIGTKLEGSGTR